MVRAAWFVQNLTEGAFRDAVADGVLALPAGEVAEPFVDADDVAEVAAAALTGDVPAGRVYEVTGPRALTFADLAAELDRRRRDPLRFASVAAAEWTAELRAAGVPAEEVDLLAYLFCDRPRRPQLRSRRRGAGRPGPAGRRRAGRPWRGRWPRAPGTAPAAQPVTARPSSSRPRWAAGWSPASSAAFSGFVMRALAGLPPAGRGRRDAGGERHGGAAAADDGPVRHGAPGRRGGGRGPRRRAGGPGVARSCWPAPRPTWPASSG